MEKLLTYLTYWTIRDLNPKPSDCKPDTLPIELIALSSNGPAYAGPIELIALSSNGPAYAGILT